MGDLKTQIFLQHINQAINQARDEFIKKHVPKKEKRFLVKGITYEIGICKFEESRFNLEVSSKIPQDLIHQKNGAEKYFKQVVKIMNTAEKKPAESKMENIIQNTAEMEHKERDYVKLLYEYKEDELYSLGEVDKRFKRHQSKNIPIPEYSGVTTPSGKLVIAIMEEKMGKFVRQIVHDFMKANEEVKKKTKSLPSRPSKKTSKPKKAAAKKASAKKVSAKKSAARPKKKATGA